MNKRANLQDVSVSLERVHECSIERSRARSVGVLRHLVIHRRQLTKTWKMNGWTHGQKRHQGNQETSR